MKDDVDRVLTYMRQLGRTSDAVDAAAYRSWPVFRTIRKETLFVETFESVFGEPFVKATSIDETK